MKKSVLKGDRLNPNIGCFSHVLIFMASFALVFLRRPDALLNPQFWAEDGAVWYADAYNGGLFPLVIPQNGYLQSVSRLAAASAQLVPFSWGPLIFNVIAIIIQILPVHLMLSSRFSVLMPNLYSRILLSTLYLALPNSWEIHANVTNAQWHLALLAFMVIAAEPSSRRIWRCFDAGVILLSGVSGPFSILLTPIAALRSLLRRDKWLFTLLVLVIMSAFVQLACFVLTGQSRSQMSLGATPELFVRILSGQIFAGALIGQAGYEYLISHHVWNTITASVVAGAGFLIMIIALFKAPAELRLFILFAAFIVGACLITPQASASLPQWEVLSLPGVGGRYWFIPMLSFVCTLAWMYRNSRLAVLRLFAATALLIMITGIILDWRHPPYVDFHFPGYAHRFEMSPQGTKILIPINPPGFGMGLLKH